MALSREVTVALMRLRLVERAIHDHGAWELEWAGLRAPVSRFTREGSVSLVAHFPPACPIDDDASTRIGLIIDGDLVHVFPLSEPLPEDGCEVWIDLSLHAEVTVSG